MRNEIINQEPWIILGNFNMILSHADTTSTNPNLGTMLQFNNLIHDLDLLDFPLIGRSYTWSSTRPTPTFSKLDCVLLSNQWNAMGATYQLTDASQTASDHAPMILHVKPHLTNGGRSFRFETHWIDHPDIKEVIANAWNSNQSEGITNRANRLDQKIRDTQKTLTKWALDTYKKRDTFLCRSKWVV